VVRHRVAISRDEEARALPGDLATAASAAATRHLTVGHAEAAEKLTQAGRNLIVIEAHAACLWAARNFHAHGNHRRLHLLDDVGKTDRRLKLARLLAEVLCVGGLIAGVGIEAGRYDQRSGADACDGAGEKNGAARGENSALERGRL